jgi:adenylate kinase
MILVTGIPGVGKSSLSVECANNSAHMKAFEVGQLMFELGAREGLLRSKEELGTLDIEVRRDLQNRVVRQIVDQDSQGLLVAHLVVSTPDGYVPGFPDQAMESLQIDAVAHIVASTSDIERRRPSVSYSLPRYLSLAKAASERLSETKGCPLWEIENNDGLLHEAADELARLLRTLG